MKKIGLITVCLFANLTVLFPQNEKLPILDPDFLSREVEWTHPGKINSKKLEFSPSWYGNGIVFVGEPRRGNSPFFRLWYAAIDHGQPESIFPFQLPGDSIVHEGPLCFSSDGDQVFFTRNNIVDGLPDSDEKLKVRLTIYSSFKSLDGSWSMPVKLPFNSGNFDCGHPSWDERNQRLFFSSNMPGGYGGMDLYVSQWDGQQWSLASNLGEDINSSAHEFFPFYHSSGTLIYSSDRKGGAGGYDHYLSRTDRGDFQSPEWLTEPFNSAGDDFGLILDESARQGFFTSNRKQSKGGDDLFHFRSELSVLGISSEKRILTISVCDSVSSLPIEGAAILVLPVSDISANGLGELFEPVFENLAERPGEFVIRYRLKKDMDPDLYLHRTTSEGIIRMDAESGQNYLVQGQADGYRWQKKLIRAEDGKQGESHVLSLVPIGADVTEIGLKDIEDRSVYDVNMVVTDRTTGETRYLFSGKNEPFNHKFHPHRDYTISVEKDGYIPQSVTYRTDIGPPRFVLEKEKEKEGLPEEVPLLEPEEETVIILEDIFYDYDQYSIREDQAYELDILADLLLQFTEIYIELSAHTDSRGPADYNFELSRKRAREAKKYLVTKGIEAERIQASGYGETRLRNNCSDGVECSEEQHRYNRRTEVKILEQPKD